MSRDPKTETLTENAAWKRAHLLRPALMGREAHSPRIWST